MVSEILKNETMVITGAKGASANVSVVSGGVPATGSVSVSVGGGAKLVDLPKDEFDAALDEVSGKLDDMAARALKARQEGRTRQAANRK